MAQVPMVYQETRLSAGPLSTLQINTAARGRKRAFDEIAGLDENTYARKHLATEAAVFFRSQARSPRSFLWRVLDDRKLLEIQCIDLTQKQRDEAGERLTFHITFDEPIRQHGIALSDPEDTDALEIFVLARNELTTITLKRDLLTRTSVPTDFDPSPYIKRYTSSPLTFRNPYRLFAPSSLELYVTLNDGGFIRMERKANESGSQWREMLYNEGGLMGTLRGLNPLKRRQTIRYGDLDLEPQALANLVKSPDGKHVWAVGLDHTLRAWSTSTWKLVVTMDLLGEPAGEENARAKKQYLMSAEVGPVVQIVSSPPSRSKKAVARRDASKYYLVVNSPKNHEFKIYSVGHSFSSVEDEKEQLDIQPFPTPAMIPPVEELLNTNIWQMEQFFMRPGPDFNDSQLWIRVRSGAMSRIFHLHFNLSSEEADEYDFDTIWREGWSAVDPGMLTTERLKESAGFPGELDNFCAVPTTPSEKWLEFLFYPGRFSSASLEAALHIYRTGRGLTTKSRQPQSLEQQPLAEKLVDAITSKIVQRQLPNKTPDYDRYQVDIQAQWQMYYSVLSHLHTRRHDTLSLCFDDQQGLAWSICADFVAPVRKFSELELRRENSWLLHDTDDAGAQPLYEEIYPRGDDIFVGSRIMAAAGELRKSFSANFNDRFREMAEEYALNDSPEETSVKLKAFFESCSFELEVTDEEFEALNAGAEPVGGLGALKTDQLLMIIEWLDSVGTLQSTASQESVVPNRYGELFNMAVARETVQRTNSTLLDLLSLVVFMAEGLEESELDNEFQPSEIYDAIMLRLRHNSLLLWLVSHSRPEPNPAAPDTFKSVLLLEDIFGGDWRAYNIKNAEMPELLTAWSQAWVAGPDVAAEWNVITAGIMARLIKKDELDLATDFQRYLSDDAWSTYLIGRLDLSRGNHSLAAQSFKDAASVLAEWQDVARAGGADLLRPDEQQRFGQGLSSYYQHILALFEKMQAYSYMAEFAELALDGFDVVDHTRSIRELDRKKSQRGAKAEETAKMVTQELGLLRLSESYAEVLGRLFVALKHTGRYEEACQALVKIPTPELRMKNIKELIEACVKNDDVPSLLRCPWNADVADEADVQLLALAKAGLASSSPPRHVPYYQVLYAFRVQRGNFRGAAEIVYEHLERLRLSNSYAVQNPEDETLISVYVLLINTLACCGEDDAWILAESIKHVHPQGAKRRLVTLADVRREYAAELDKRSDILQGRFPLVGDGDEMDVL